MEVMNQINIRNLFVGFISCFLLSCNGSGKTEKTIKCECVKEAILRISISAKSEAEARKTCSEKLGGQIQSCE